MFIFELPIIDNMLIFLIISVNTLRQGGIQMQSNKTCPLFEQYLSYLIVIKGRSENTILDYRTDLLMFFRFIIDSRNHNTHKLIGIF